MNIKLISLLLLSLIAVALIVALSGCALYKLDQQTAPHFETAKQKADRQAAEVARYLNVK